MKARSAYFSNDDDDRCDSINSGEISFLAPAPPQHQNHIAINDNQLLVHSTPGHSEFPITSYILWDRTPLEAQRITLPSRGDTLPPLLLSSEVINDLLNQMVQHQSKLSPSSSGNLVFTAEMCSRGLLNLSSPSNSTQNDPIPVISTNALSIPITVISHSHSMSSLLFEKDSTTAMYRNLQTQIATGRNHALKASLRIRAKGFITNTTSTSLQATMRFEALCPNDALTFQKIRPPPLLSTPLSIRLTCNPPTGTAPSSSSLRPHMGYLTLNKTRKLVPLLETDPAVSLAPLVGIWVSVDDCANIHRNPFVSGACTRFIHDARIRERVYVDTRNTFLVANFTLHSSEYFEVSSSSAAAIARGEEIDEFCVLDFTVDVSRNGEPVMCRFKGDNRSGVATGLPEHDEQAANTHSEPPRVVIRPYGEVQILVTEETPLPRCRPVPAPTPDSQQRSSLGVLRSSLTLSDGTCSNRTSLELAQLMSVGELGSIGGGSQEYEEYQEEDEDEEEDEEYGDEEKGSEEEHEYEYEEEEDGYGEGEECEGEDEEEAAESRARVVSPPRPSLAQANIAHCANNLNSNDAHLSDEDTLLAPLLMRIPTDDSDFTLSRDMRRIYFPTNPLASLAPVMPALRPQGEDDSLLMETGFAGARLSVSSSNGFESSLQDLDAQVWEILQGDDL